MPLRRDGRPAVNEMGPYIFKYRAETLKRLLQVQKELQEQSR
jgi:DNA sulfur modification protein DndC